MKATRKIFYLRDTEHLAKKIIQHGPVCVDDAITLLGKKIDRSNCLDTIVACEKLVEVLNEGPMVRTINQLTEEQSRFAAQLLTAVHDYVTLSV